MSVRVRLTRVGSKKNPVWRVVVADQRSPRDGRIIESIGHYNPQTEPSTIVIDRERLQHWVDQGAQPTNTVRKLLRAPNTVMKAVAVAPEAAPDEPDADSAEAPAPTPPPEGDAEAEASTEEGEAGTVPTPDERGDAESPAEGADAPGGSADSDADAGPSGAAVEPAEADEAPADADAAT